MDIYEKREVIKTSKGLGWQMTVNYIGAQSLREIGVSPDKEK